MNIAMLVALLLAVLGPAGSETPSSAALPAIEASGSCPSAEEVSATLAPLLGSSAPKVPVEGAARVHDLGDRFEVAAAGQTGQYVDAARDCAERARVAAVFIALALNPPAAPTGPRVDAQPSAEPSGSGTIGFALVGAPGARRPGRAFANGRRSIRARPPLSVPSSGPSSESSRSASPLRAVSSPRRLSPLARCRSMNSDFLSASPRRCVTRCPGPSSSREISVCPLFF